MSHRYLVAAAIAVTVTAPVSAQSVKAGIDAWQRADYAAAVAIWRPLAERGDSDAQFNLGQAYRLGRGVSLDLGGARMWFERAARNGHLDALTTLGLLTFQNGDRPGGLKWLKQAADQGEPRALLVYGTALFNGDGIAQDRVLGYAYVSRAAAQGLGPAQETLDQLDQLMPVSDRQKGVALARSIAAKAPPPSSRPKPVKVAQPNSRATKAAPAPPATGSGGWRIQLGAFAQRSSAESLYRRVGSKSALAGRSAYYVGNGSVTRLQIGPFASKQAAAAACDAIGVACFPVAAN